MRERVDFEADSRSQLIPGPVIKELIQPVPNSIGVVLLEKMGWRQGKGLEESQDVLSPGTKWGHQAAVLAQNSELFLPKPKVKLFVQIES